MVEMVVFVPILQNFAANNLHPPHILHSYVSVFPRWGGNIQSEETNVMPEKYAKTLGEKTQDMMKKIGGSALRVKKYR